MIVYLCDPTNSVRELLQLINKLSKVAGYKINSHKSVAFLYTKDKHVEKEMRKKIYFIILTKTMKYFGATLTEQVKDLYDKNFKPPKKEIEEENRKISHAHGLEGSTL